MTAPSPARQTGLGLKLVLTVDDTEFDTDRLVSVETWSQANRVPRARIVLYDGEPDTGKFPFSSAATFVPGAKVKVAAGYGSDAKTIHSGIVIRHAIRILPGTPAQLVLETADPLLKMTLARHSGVNQKTSDKALIETLVSANGGSVTASKASTDVVEAIVQAYASDWDLMLLRAEASGCVALVDDGKVQVISPADQTSPVLSLEYGDSIIAFDATVDASGLLGADSVSSQAWSYADQSVTKAGAGSADIGVPGNLKPATLAAVMGVSPYTQQTGAAKAEAALTSWSSAALMRARLSQVVGTVKFQGSALAKAGSRVTLAGLGDRFNGDAFVSGVRHQLRDGDWQSVIEIGMAGERFASLDRSIADAPAAGLSAPIRGLQTGQVKQVAQDPDGDFRVLVTLPLVDAANGIWARLGQPYASKDVGWSFFPEIGDEVVLGFMNEDPESAVILASVYSNQRAPTHAPTDGNDVKALVTHSKMEVNFNDKDVILKISTPGGRYFTLDDKNGTVTVADPNGNKLVMSADKVDLISTAALNIKSTGDMTIQSDANLTIKAAIKLDASAPEVGVTGQSNLALASNAMASLKAGAVLEVNGALVKIN